MLFSKNVLSKQPATLEWVATLNYNITSNIIIAFFLFNSNCISISFTSRNSNVFQKVNGGY